MFANITLPDGTDLVAVVSTLDGPLLAWLDGEPVEADDLDDDAKVLVDALADFGVVPVRSSPSNGDDPE